MEAVSLKGCLDSQCKQCPVQYLASAPVGVLTLSLDIGMPPKPEEMERMFVRLMRPAIESALGPQA